MYEVKHLAEDRLEVQHALKMTAQIRPLLLASMVVCLSVLVMPAFASEPVVFEADSAAANYFDGAEQRSCSGRIAALYLNRPDPDGSYQGYRDAAVANAAWLSSKGYEDVELSTFIARDQADALAFGNGGNHWYR